MICIRQTAGMASQNATVDSIASFYRTLKGGALCAIALGLGITTSAYAQESGQPAPADRSLTLDEVTVTGTRIKQREDYVSPNPISTIDSSEMQRLGIVNVSDAVTQVPSNISQFTPANTGGSAFFVGSTLANLRGLNPFFGTRTLTLVDTHRFIPTTQGDSVDLNFIPSNLIERTEIVTGGASAAYGSGAISGVVNVLLNHRLEGLKLDMDYGASEKGDGDNYHVGLAGGTDLFAGRSHVIFGLEYQKQDVIQSCSDARDWCAKGVGAFSNDSSFAFTPGQDYTGPPAFSPPGTPPRQKIPGQPWQIITSNLRQNQLSHSGVLFRNTPNATSTLQFNAAGTDLVPYAIGAEGWRATGGTVVGGDGEPTYKNLSLFPDVERKIAYTRMSFEVTDGLEAFAEGSWGQVEGTNHQWAPGQNTAYACIRPDNAFLLASTQSVRDAFGALISNAPNATAPNATCGGPFAAPGAAGTVLTKDWSDQNDQTVMTDTKVIRGVVGLNGAIGTSSWSWETYYQYGKTTRDQIGSGYRTNWRYDLAIDAVIDNRPGSATNGQAVCRVTRDGVSPFAQFDPILAVGCQPLNAFGTTAASQQALAYAFGSLTEHDDIRQDVVAASLTGEVWKGLGAGPFAAATGLEWRRDQLANLAGDLPFSQRTDFGLQYGDSFEGKTTVKEAFLELEMPLLKDRPGARIATLNGAVRQAKYKNEGGLGTTGQTGEQDITTWKFAAVWDPVEWLRFRGSRSRDLRAASFRELYYSQSIPAGGFFGSVQNSQIVVNPGAGVFSATDAAVLILSGNPNLEPETANTTTGGFVVSPGGWADGMHLSLDYYKIVITGGQALEVTQNVVNQCYDAVNPNPAKCAQITFGAPLPGQGAQSNIAQVRALYINSLPYETQGVDLGWDYLMPMDNLFSGSQGSLAFRLQGTYALKSIIQNANRRDIAGQTGADQGFLSDFAAAPNFSANFTASYLNGPLALTVQTRWVGAGRLDKQNPKLGPGDEGYNPNLTYSVSDSDVPSYYAVNLNGSYDFKWFGLENLQLFGNVSNLFDRDPPFSAGQVGGVNAVFFDALGRTYRAGMRVQF
jgi:iron complex outermembrane recepter protein